MFSFFNRTKKNAAITQTAFSCQRDGLTIRGTEFRPAGKNLPAAIVCHGFMGTEETVRQYAMPLAQLGFAVYTFDFCGGNPGNGKSDGATTDMSVLTEVKDLEAVIEAVLKHEKADASRLMLMGCSQGGFVSALVAAKHPGMVEKLVLFYPALSIPDDARKGQMLMAKFDPSNVPEKIKCGFMMLGRCYVSDVIEMDAFKEIAAYEGPVLILHGTADNAVDCSNSKKAVEVYKNARLELIEGAGHGFFKENGVRALELLREFAN